MTIAVAKFSSLSSQSIGLSAIPQRDDDKPAEFLHTLKSGKPSNIIVNKICKFVLKFTANEQRKLGTAVSSQTESLRCHRPRSRV
jgi:hypothetical protein